MLQASISVKEMGQLYYNDRSCVVDRLFHSLIYANSAVMIFGPCMHAYMRMDACCAVIL